MREKFQWADEAAIWLGRVSDGLVPPASPCVFFSSPVIQLMMQGLSKRTVCLPLFFLFMCPCSPHLLLTSFVHFLLLRNVIIICLLLVGLFRSPRKRLWTWLRRRINSHRLLGGVRALLPWKSQVAVVANTPLPFPLLRLDLVQFANPPSPAISCLFVKSDVRLWERVARVVPILGEGSIFNSRPTSLP